MPITAYGAAKHLNKDFGGTNYTEPATWYLGFRLEGTELSGDSYARVAITNNTTNFPATSTGVMPSGTLITLTTLTAEKTADEAVLYDASSGGNAWYTGPLDPPLVFKAGQSREVSIGELRVTEN